MTSPDMRPGTGPTRAVLRFAASVAVAVVACLAATLVLSPETYLALGEPKADLEQPCDGVSEATVAAAVPDARRRVHEAPAGAHWKCRWRSADTTVLRRTNPILEIEATRHDWGGGLPPKRRAAKEYGDEAVRQLRESGYHRLDARARRSGIGVQVVRSIGDRAQVSVEPKGLDDNGHQATVLAVRREVVVTVTYLAYRTDPRTVRSTAVRAAGEVVRAL